MSGILIIDDEQHVAEALTNMIEMYAPGFEVLGSCNNLLTAKDAIRELKPGIVLLDVEMGDEKGLDIAKHFPQQPFKLIFITAHQNYAVDAFRLSAVDYLLKPVNPVLLAKALLKAKNAIDAELLSSKLDDVLHHTMINSKRNKKIVLKTLESVHVVDLEDIMYCEAHGGYTTFYLSDKSRIVISNTLGEYEGHFADYGFVRIHHSYLLNIHYIKRFDKLSDSNVVLKDNTSLPVAVRKRDQLLEALQKL